MSNPNPSDRGCVVYLLRDARTGHAVYVGIGDVTRALDEHVDNPRLAARIKRGQLTVSVMTTPDRRTAETVEAALIAALTAEPDGDQRMTNRNAGHGGGFAPIGVPAPLAHRAAAPPLILIELGELTGGCLIVRVGESTLDDGRTPIDPLNVVDADVAAAVAGVWQIPDDLVEAWAADHADAPKVIVGAAGPVTSRYCPAAMRIDHARLRTTQGSTLKALPIVGEHQNAPTPAARLAGVDLDAAGLRGCRIAAELRFGGIRPQFWMWVDGSGQIRAGGRR